MVTKAKKVLQEFVQKPANRYYVFAKNCTNSHGSFKKGDKARGAFAPDLIKAYLLVGILVERNDG